MWFDGQRQPNTLYVANTSRGKDSTAMLRAIQLMGWPLDMICSVDIWFDEDTPAELPPMVEFKNEYDRKILDWFGVPVTRLCATKRSQTVNVERERESQSQTESVTHNASHTAECSMTGCHQEAVLKERSEDSRCVEEAGARSSRPTKLTYCDIFYRRLKPRERERERRRGTSRGFPIVRGTWCNSDLKRSALQDFRLRALLVAEWDGVQENSRRPYYGIPDFGQSRKLVYTPQADPIKGFPWRKGAWCQDRLKGNF